MYASSTINGMKIDSFYIDQVEKYNVKYNPKAQTANNTMNFND